MKKSSLEHRSLAQLKGFWKVVYHGSLHNCLDRENSPRISIFFGKLKNQTNPVTVDDFRTEGAPVEIRVPVGELMRLPTNIVINDCRIAFDPNKSLPSEKAAEFDMSLDRAAMHLFSRFSVDDNHQHLIPLRLGKTPNQSNEDAKSYYIAFAKEDNPYWLVIPCSEIFRFFYCVSSKLATTILSTRILDPNRYIINPTHTGVDASNPRIAVVCLRQWMLNQDRRHIASLFFSPGAFSEAQNIFLTAAGHVDADESVLERALVAYPPAHGPLSIKAIYRECNIGGYPSNFVTRMVSSDWSLDFDTIYYRRDNDSEQVVTDEERKKLQLQKRHGPPATPAIGSKISSLIDEASSSLISEMELADEDFAVRFPNLDKISSPKIQKDEQTSRGIDNRVRIEVKQGSVVEFSHKTGERVAATVLRAMTLEEEIRKRREEQLSQNQALPRFKIDIPKKLDDIIDLLEKAAYDVNVEIQYLPVLKEFGLYREKLVNRLPETFNGHDYKWLYIDPEMNTTRMVLVAKITYMGRIRYLIEFSHAKNAPGGTSMLVLWHHEEQPLPDSNLRLAIEGCMENQCVSLKDCVLLQFCCGCRLSHSESTKKDYQSLLNKIFDHATDKMAFLINPALKT